MLPDSATYWSAATGGINYGDGNIGIGTTNPASKLDVNGAIRVGTDVTACSAVNAGAIRYNSGNVEYCNSTSWTIFSADEAMAAYTLKGNISGVAAAPTDIAVSTLQGTSATTFAAGNDSRITGALQKAGGSMTGSLTLTTGIATRAPLRLPSGTLVTVPTSGNIENDGSNIYWTNSVPTRQKLANYSGTPGNGQLLIGDGSGFSLANITQGSGITITNSAGGITISATENGTVASVSSANADIGVATPTSTPVLTLNSGTGANQIVKLDSSAKLPAVDGSQLTNLQASQIPDLDATVIATGTIASARLPASASYWSAATGGINYSGGNVGIGTTNPIYPLDVNGVIRSQSLIASGYVRTSFNDSVAYTSTSASASSPSGSTSKGIKIVNDQATTNTGAFLSYEVGNTSDNYQKAYFGAISLPGPTVYTPAIVIGQQTGSNAYAERLRIDSTGNVGIGTTTPTAALEVNGSIKAAGQTYSGANIVATGGNIDFNTGNIQVLQSVGESSISLANMKNGGSYVLVVTDATSRTYSFPACTVAQFSPANGATTPDTTTIFKILSVTISATQYCFISWGSGYQ